MRVLTFVGALLFAMQAVAAEVDVASRVDTVTVFPRGAEVVRVAKIQIGKGAHQLVLRTLPAQAIAETIRVEGKSAGRLEIGSVDSRLVQVTSNEAADAARKRLEDEIERIGDQIATFEAAIGSKTIQKRFIVNLTQLPIRPVPNGAGGTATGEDWSAIFDLIGSRLADVESAILDTNIKIRDAKRRQKDLQKKLAVFAPNRMRRTEVTINVVAAEDLEAELSVTYQVAQAGWSPRYDARLETGSRSVPAKLVLTRRAIIHQTTDEAWRDVGVSLSTTRPAGRSAAPRLPPLLVDFLPPPAPPPAAGYAEREEERKAVRKFRSLGGARSQDQVAPVAAAKPQAQPAQERVARVTQAAFQAIFKVPDRITVANTGDPSRVKIADTQLEPALGVRTVPKRDRQAYLYAKIQLPKTAPYLPGRVSLFRDHTFVGMGQLPQLAPGETHEIGFGPDDLVRVKYEVIREKKGETGLISSSRTDQRQYKITLRNLHERPIAFTILDQVPVSLDEKIKVELNGRTPPTASDVKGKRGVLAWSGKLGADEEKVVDFGFQISWPAEKQIRYRQ
jgi:uncharacterized protein (TIGR02231 family)